MEGFKYCKAEHMEGFFANGRLRIGTLRDFARPEVHGVRVGDAGEGTIALSAEIDLLTKESLAAYPHISRVIGVGEGATHERLVFSNNNFVEQNLYLFSVSDSYSAEAHNGWRADKYARYDACYRIRSLRLFFCELTAAMTSHGTFIGFGSVQYVDPMKGVDPHTALSPAMFKGSKGYANQVEIRGLWRPHDPNPEPVIVDVPLARAYCVRHRVLPAEQ